MYLFTYAADDDNSNELYSEFHLGRKAYRFCKKGTKFCAWNQGLPDFHTWKHFCKTLLKLNLYLSYITLKGLTYDAWKDTYKVYVDGEKMDSGSWSDNPNVSE